MLYCCGGREKEEKEHTGANEALISSGEPETVTVENREESPAAGMFDIADLPELLPPSEQLQPNPPDSACQMQHLGGEFNRDCLSPECHQRRLGQRAPKLGQIGRSKRVVIEDEDLDDIMNNSNGSPPVPLSNAPS
ncbi:calcium/calmodulin-dependent protein kinase II inhibitor 2-like [Myxocyprinus asiaticus]|uniref:calcium/calmodulin-dependent protein kinase II inhibitor 2-like n=1 Tax=Myxocyprinus asiaticus TaxID=70543 RepID=UPI0022228970|nr:calcium/calmodulin-dependent protein kinase II inhibitor 2-like [Myxocyprinus asiaticus]